MFCQVSAFYANDAPPTHLVRFCFCKDDQKLVAACDRLQSYLHPQLAAAS